MKIGEGVIVHTFSEIDGIEDFDLIPLAKHQASALDGNAALRISDHIGRMALHQVGLEPKPRLSASRAADDHYVFIPRRLGVFRAV